MANDDSVTCQEECDHIINCSPAKLAAALLRTESYYRKLTRVQAMEGWHGWDAYAPFYDWENAQTLGRKDISFWCQLARRASGPILELGCGTGRVSAPVARVAKSLVAIDRSEAMLDRAHIRLRRSRVRSRVKLLRGDIRLLPFRRRTKFDLVMAPYGILQSLVREADLTATLSAVARVTKKGSRFGVDLVPDLLRWDEYKRHVALRGQQRARGSHLTLIESVRQDRARHLTIFDQEYVERKGSHRTTHRFSLTFRTLSIRQITRRLERAGFHVEAVLGDYSGSEWNSSAEVWVVLAKRL